MFSQNKTGTMIVAGVPSFDDGVRSSLGKTFIYAHDGSSWVQRGQELEGSREGQKFGSDVALSSTDNIASDVVAVRDGDGRTHVFRWNTNRWTGTAIAGSFTNFTDDSVSLERRGACAETGQRCGDPSLENVSVGASDR